MPYHFNIIILRDICTPLYLYNLISGFPKSKKLVKTQEKHSMLVRLAESDFSKTFKNNLWWVAAQFILEVAVLMGWLPILGL